MRKVKNMWLIISLFLCVSSSFLSLFFLMGGLGNFRLPSYYGDVEMYVETQIIVKKLEYFDDCVVVIEEDENNYEHRYVIDGDNYNIFNEKRKENKLEENDLITIHTAYGYFGDGWLYPIASLKCVDYVYYDFEVGRLNIVNKWENFNNRNRKIWAVMVPINVCSLISSIVFYKINYKEYNNKGLIRN